MVNQKFLIFDYDDTIMPSSVSRTLSNQPDYGASSVKDHLNSFFQFILYWKKTTGIPIVILSAGTIAYLHLVSLYGKYLRISVNYFDPRMDICMFLPIPFVNILGKREDYLKLSNNNDVSTLLQKNMINYYYSVFSKYQGSNFYSIHPSQISEAVNQSNELLPGNAREFINGISHKKVVYVQQSFDKQSMSGCFYLPGVNYYKEVGFYEFLNCRRQFKDLDALRKHFSFVLGKPTKAIHFYFFDDRASHIGMGDDDIYLSKPHTYSSNLFVNKLLPILQSLMESGDACQTQTSENQRECMRRQEIKLLNRLVSKLSSEKKLVFVAKHDGASPIAKRQRSTAKTTTVAETVTKGQSVTKEQTSANVPVVTKRRRAKVTKLKIE